MENVIKEAKSLNSQMLASPLKYMNIIKSIISNSNDKNLIILRLDNKTSPYTITYIDRKLFVFGLTFVSVFLHYFRAFNKGFRYRLFIPYFTIYSLLFYREVLNPYTV